MIVDRATDDFLDSGSVEPMDDSKSQFRSPRIGAIVAVAALVAFLVWVLAVDDDETTPNTPAVTAPVATSHADLASLSDELGHPIYWAGERGGAQVEIHRSERGDVFLRYLTGDAEIGDSRENYLTVGTYPFPGAYEVLMQQAEDAGSLTNETPDGGFVFTNQGNPTSVYIAYPDQDLQIEVFDPDPARALELATSGEIVPVD